MQVLSAKSSVNWSVCLNSTLELLRWDCASIVGGGMCVIV